MSRLLRLVLLCLCGAPAAAAQGEAGLARVAAAPSALPGEPGAVAPALAEAPVARVRWRFRSASPVSGPPGVGAAGQVYVTSVDGHVHALGPDGRFRWSHGLGGAPLGAPALDAGGRVYVATREGKLYALDSEGRLLWSRKVGSRLASGPLWAQGSLYVAGRDGGLYGVPGAGGAPSRIELGAPASAGLASFGAGRVALGTGDGAALLCERARVVTRLELPGPLVQPLLGGSERWFAVTAEGIFAFEPASRELAWSAPARRAALSADRRALLVEADRELRWLSPRTGEVLGRAPLPGDVSARLGLTNAGVALVPLVTGELSLVAPVAPARRVAIGAAPLWAPVYDEAQRRVTVAAGGALVAVELEAGGGAAAARHADAGGGA